MAIFEDDRSCSTFCICINAEFVRIFIFVFLNCRKDENNGKGKGKQTFLVRNIYSWVRSMKLFCFIAYRSTKLKGIGPLEGVTW